jgi:hypothetical protein
MLTNVLIFAAIFLGVIAFTIHRSVRAMAESPEPQSKPDWADRIKAAVPPDIASFLATKGFSFTEAYGFHQVWFGIWTQKGGASPSRRFCLSRTPNGGTEEFVTDFSDDASLTTTKTRSAFVFPRVFGGFMQSFPRASIDELWDAHQRGEQYLVSEVSIPVRACRLPYLERLKQGIVQQTAYIRSLSLWPLRGIYWYLVKRFPMHNRPIWKQNISRTYKQVPERDWGH